VRVWERFAAISLALGLMLSVAPTANAGGFPKHIDPKSWEVPEDMTWGDYKRIPGLDWLSEENQPPKKLRAALILGDFTDQPFRVEMTTVDPTGQKGLGVGNAAEYWLDYLFLNENSNADNHGHTVNEYWLENSFGLLGVDAEAFGPYHLEGKMYEYGVRDFGGDADCPDGPDGCNGNFDEELVAASLLDVTAAQAQQGDFDFRFLLHAGYDESGMWLNYGMALFPEPEAVSDKYGPANPDHRNWATTRYVPWTSFFSAQNIWSHALPGTLATEGESDGGSVYAHELSHVLGVLDNYNNPYDENPKRAYSGPWDMMSRGTFNGPGGPFERYTIPPTQGTTMGSHHMLRNKLRMGFTPATEVLTVSRGALEAAGIISTTILQRESPPAVDDPNLNSGIRIALGEDRHECDYSESLCDGGNYDFYDVEVVNRQGFDSFIPDHGVLIAKTKTADLSPFIWVVDAHPKDINKIDYVTADGTKVPYTIGDYRQLADAAFHAGTAPGTKNMYVDEANALAFYVLDTKVVDGWRTYDVAVQSLDSPNVGGEAEIKKVKGKVTKRVTPQVFEITNPGTGPAVYILKAKAGSGVKTRLLNDLVYVGPGETAKVKVWAKRTGTGRSLKLTASTL
jgi:M6 family metalloprotease-like protein